MASAANDSEAVESGVVDDDDDDDDDDGAAAARDFTDVTHESYGSKLQESCSGTCTGLFLFVGSIGLLIFNEGRTVKRAKDLDEGLDTVVSVHLGHNLTSSSKASLENKLIHAYGELGTDDVLTDPIFGVPKSSNSTSSSSSSSNSHKPLLKLQRSVQMYQWHETSRSTTTKNSDGSTTTRTTYSYSKKWSSHRIDSSRFRESLHTNPDFPFDPSTLAADPIYLGNERLLVLTDAAVDYIDWYEPLPGAVTVSDVPDTALQSRLTTYSANGFFYQSNLNKDSSNNNPIVGDARITFDVVEAGSISIVAKLAPSSQGRSSLDTYTTSRGGDLLLVERGSRTSLEMFAEAQADNTFLAWVYRFVGFFLMVVSILMILQPIATAVDIIPFLGDYMQAGLEGCLFPTIAVLIALPTALFVVALSWLFYRPFIAIPICACSLVVLIWLFIRHKQAQSAQTDDNVSPTTDADGKPPTPYSNAEPTVDTNAYSSNYSSSSQYPPPIKPLSSTTLYSSTYGATTGNDNHNALSPAIPVVMPAYDINTTDSGGGGGTGFEAPIAVSSYGTGSNSNNYTMTAASAPVEDDVPVSLSTMGGFASALDNPPPSEAPSYQQTTTTSYPYQR